MKSNLHTINTVITGNEVVMNVEIWNDIPGFEGLYQVSDCGQVKSCERFVKHWRGGNQILKERILKPGLNTRGYYYVVLSKDGKGKNFFIHRLVALAFLEGDNTFTVNHKDECKTNNHVSNLEYLTQADNVREWTKYNPERRAEINRNNIKKAKEASLKAQSQQVLDTQTGKTFPSIKAVGRYMHEEEGAKGPKVWFHKIRLGKQNRFQILNN